MNSTPEMLPVMLSTMATLNGSAAAAIVVNAITAPPRRTAAIWAWYALPRKRESLVELLAMTGPPAFASDLPSLAQSASRRCDGHHRLPLFSLSLKSWRWIDVRFRQFIERDAPARTVA